MISDFGIEEKVDKWFESFSKNYILVIDGPVGIEKETIIKSIYNEYFSLKKIVEIDVKKYKDIISSILKDNYISVDNFYSSLFYALGISYSSYISVVTFYNLEYCPLLRQFTKSLCEDGRFTLMATSCGSRGINHYGKLLIPSNEYVIELGVLDFNYFLLINGKGDIANYLTKKLSKKEPISEYLSREISKYYSRYLQVGGYPSVIKDYEMNNDLSRCSELNRNLLNKQLEHLHDFIPLKYEEAFNSIKNSLLDYIIKGAISCFNNKPTYYLARKIIELMVEERILIEINPFDCSKDNKNKGKKRYCFSSCGIVYALSNDINNQIKENMVLTDYFSNIKRYNQKTEYGLVRTNHSYFESAAIFSSKNQKYSIDIKLKSLSTAKQVNLSMFSNGQLKEGIVLFDGNIFKYGKTIVLPLYCASLIKQDLFS